MDSENTKKRPPGGGSRNYFNTFNTNAARGRFNKQRLPSPGKYYRDLRLELRGGAEWKLALCPFHKDTKPSLNVRLDSGGFKCWSCGAHGGDVLAFHQLLHGLDFVAAAKDLGAWEWPQ
jgi:hypothetical protein